MYANAVGTGSVYLHKNLFLGAMFRPDYRYTLDIGTLSYGGNPRGYIDPITQKINAKYSPTLPSHRIIALSLHKALIKNCKNFPKLEEAHESCNAPVFGMFGCPSMKGK
jgi:hypothetical protein